MNLSYVCYITLNNSLLMNRELVNFMIDCIPRNVVYTVEYLSLIISYVLVGC
jgi:hypothetical protein